MRDILREICAETGMEIVKGNIRPNHVHILIGAPAHLSAGKIAQYLKGKSSHRLQREFPILQKRYWGRHLWGRGYFCNTVGSVTEEQIQQYIANQSDEPGTFKVWDESKLDALVELKGLSINNTNFSPSDDRAGQMNESQIAPIGLFEPYQDLAKAVHP